MAPDALAEKANISELVMDNPRFGHQRPCLAIDRRRVHCSGDDADHGAIFIEHWGAAMARMDVGTDLKNRA
jgi:hypothetical protein